MFQDGHGMRREPTMIAINDPGYSHITDQETEPWSDIPLGSSTIGKMGCGHVAVYNAMLSLDDYRSF